VYGAPPIAIGQLSVPDKNPVGAVLGGEPAPDDDEGVGSAAGVVCPADADGEAGAADLVCDGLALGAAPVDPVCAALPQAASAASNTAMPAGASRLVYRWLREPPKERCGFNRYQRSS
jgi:hypothetical protein